jgi:hypothetical protein
MERAGQAEGQICLEIGGLLNKMWQVWDEPMSVFPGLRALRE